MKVILSRKGFDSSNGEIPSPIFPDGTMLSLPIPAPKGDRYQFGQLRHGNLSLPDLVAQLSGKPAHATCSVHLDPDIDRDLVSRPEPWTPALGQSQSAQSHLANQDVGPGDLFLFYGWFREVEERGGQYAYRRGAPDLHVIFGWLQVGSVWNINQERDALVAAHPGVAQHAHLYDLPKYTTRPNNTLYVAAPTLHGPGLDALRLPGAGVFRQLASARVLTGDKMSRRYWRLPKWFHNSGKPILSYHFDPKLPSSTVKLVSH